MRTVLTAKPNSGRLSPDLLTPHQQEATTKLVERDQLLLVAPTGAGKTVMCLTAIEELRDHGIGPVIVACPAKVVPNWARDAQKWEHLQGLTVVELVGTPEQRVKLLDQPADVYVISLNSLDWVLTRKHGCSGIVIDEITKAAGKQGRKLYSKSHGAPFIWRIGLTATPVSQDYQKLFGMVRLLDSGATFGRNKSFFMQKYFDSDFMGYNWTLKHNGAERIHAALATLVHVMPDMKAEMLPELTYHKHEFNMTCEAQEAFKRMRDEFVVGDVEAVNAAVRDAKLRQIASGFLYDEDDVIDIDLNRATATMQVVERAIKEQGSCVVFYEYSHQVTQLEYLLKDRMVDYEVVRGGMADKAQRVAIDAFKDGEVEVLVAQINSMSHGVDGLQLRSNVAIFMQPVWSNDATEQAIGRLWRTGQVKPVQIHTIEALASLDGRVITRVDDRKSFMKIFSEALKESE